MGPPVRLPVRLLFLIVTGLATAACGMDGANEPAGTPVRPNDGVLVVRAVEWGYEPETIALERGQQVRLLLENDGALLHDLKVEELTADVIESRSTGPLSAGEDDIFTAAEVGEQGDVVFVPRESGTFAMFCTLPGHRQLGMEGTLIVE